MGFISVLGMARRLVKERVSPGDAVVDATCGNGVDTQFLAELVGPRGAVYAFDIQEAALERTRSRIEAAIGGTYGAGAPDAGGLHEADIRPLRLVHASHADMDKHVAEAHRGSVAAVMFNLGYLPGADQAVITEPASTLAALEAALRLLRPGGILTAVLYPGHPGGLEEAEAVAAWASSLPQPLGQAMLYRLIQKAEAPYLAAVEKKA
ncbi:class I SAM-dependent methyltransferase [Paenibacillus glycinis]|uniref:Methyltransferase domain-containing protein n=1 Tax=Paenibacillus glycinis TaxID=2697035 RepID=A0ABW9XYX8_9BACL|nr:class I SAM-dependent methyltransferase [Paenibacillus glycinis]NBD27618.1 methyltransferase domain-containing protein [Paenibacillus glycinis]